MTSQTGGSNLAILLVNATADVERGLQDDPKKELGEKVTYTILKRPFHDDHPRLRPVGQPNFGLVLIDLTDWVGKKSDDELIETKLPDWLRKDVLQACKDCCVLMMAPSQVLNTVHHRAQTEGAQALIRDEKWYADNGKSIVSEIGRLFTWWHRSKSKGKSRKELGWEDFFGPPEGKN